MAVCVVFLLHFGQWDLALLLFASLLVYGFVTIRITLWRRKFREMSNKKDNEIHERASDTLINFETVKVLEMKYILLCICAVEYGVDVLYGLVFVRRRGATMRCTGPCPLSLNKPDDNTHTPIHTGLHQRAIREGPLPRGRSRVPGLLGHHAGVALAAQRHPAVHRPGLHGGGPDPDGAAGKSDLRCWFVVL